MTSEKIYRALLGLYPRAFRRKYGWQMAQLFHDCRLQAELERRRTGIFGLWVVTLLDLARSAPAEHLLEVNQMSRARVIRYGGFAATLGGVLFLMSLLTHPSGITRAAVPGSMVCLFGGVIGLNALLVGRQGKVGRLAFGLVAVGLLLGFIGMLGSWLGVLPPNPVAPVINTGEHLGLVFIGAGLVAWGVVALRARLLGRLSWVPLLVGLLSLSALSIVVPAAFTSIEQSVFPMVYSASWVLLGLALVTASIGAGQEAVQPVAV